MSNLIYCQACGRGYILEFGHICPMDVLHTIEVEKAIETKKADDQVMKEHQKIFLPSSDRARKNKMRNKPCPCGSNKKFKRCCWGKYA